MLADPQRSATQWAEPGNLKVPVDNITLADQSASDRMRKHHQVAASYGYAVIDTAPNERALVVLIAVSNLVLVPCTPSGLDPEDTARTLDIVKEVRTRRSRTPKLIIVPNRVDSRTLEGRQLVEELRSFRKAAGPIIGQRSAFARAFS